MSISTTITWSIKYLWVKPEYAAHTDVVVYATWVADAACQHEGKTYTSSKTASATFPLPGSPFTPYEDLTEEQVLGWCWSNGVDKAAVELELEQNIENQINPPVIPLPLPWQKS